jgi:hypothetical protein
VNEGKMSVATPEKIQNIDLYELTGISQDEAHEMESRALVREAPVVISELPEDERTRRRAAAFIGACTVGGECTVEFSAERVNPNESLYDAIQKAKEGDNTARKMVKINAKTDVIERTIKSGHITKVDLHVDAAGIIQQHGQSMESVQANSLRFAANNPQMRARIEAETTNSFRLKQLYETGELEDASFVVFSCAADNMSETKMKEVGFFTDTLSCAIQVTTANGSGLSVESAFVAGVKQPGMRDSGQRVDVETVISIGEKLGVDFSGMTATEILATPILVPNWMIKNGVLDIVQMWDKHHGDTFFGEARPKQNYEAYRQKCLEREQMLQPKVDLITEELINSADVIHDRVSAVQYLNRLSSKHMIEQAIFDTEINPKVFGAVSAVQIHEARRHIELGNLERGLELTVQAIENDQSSSCPGGLSKTDEVNNASSSDIETCTFVSRQCPQCGKKNVLTTVTTTRISGSCGCSKNKK